MTELTSQQLAGIEALRKFVASDEQVFVIHGLAGTGKTTLLTEYAQEQPMLLTAFTGKAASVLARKSGQDASTIHGLFYKLIDIGEDKHGKRILYFERVDQDLTGRIVAIDESSMVPEDIALDLLQTGAKVIAFGDPGQLPPVKGVQYFNRPDFVLTEIHRQALDSPIIRQAHAMRTHGMYCDDGEDFQVVGKATDDQLMEADVVLSFMNKTRHAVNRKVRKLLGITQHNPQKGESVVCLKNVRRSGIFNGSVYTLAASFDRDGDGTIFLEVGDSVVAVRNVCFVEHGEDINDVSEDFTTAFDFAYCLTVHKSQGSEWDHVLLLDEHRWPETRRAWCYTGISRAAKRIIVQR